MTTTFRARRVAPAADRRRRRLACALLGLLLGAPLAAGQLIRESIEQIEDVGLVRKPGNVVDMDLAFTDSRNRPVTLGDAFDGERPVVLALVYFECPLICPLTINNIQQALNGLKDWRAGDEYNLLILSFDHRDTPRRAMVERETFLAGLRHEPLEGGVHFWVGAPEQVTQLARTVGFHYKWLPDVEEFSHPTALILLRPDGTVHNYLPGLEYPPQDLRLALIEAGDGRGATLFDRFVHLCFTYSEEEGGYVVSPMRVMQIVGVVTVVALGGFLAVLFLAGRRRGGGGNPPDDAPRAAQASYDAGLRAISQE